MQLQAQIHFESSPQPELRTLMYSISVLLACIYTNSSRIPEKVQRCITQQHNGCLCLTQTNSKMAFSPDAEIKEQVLVELL